MRFEGFFFVFISPKSGWDEKVEKGQKTLSSETMDMLEQDMCVAGCWYIVDSLTLDYIAGRRG